MREKNINDRCTNCDYPYPAAERECWSGLGCCSDIPAAEHGDEDDPMHTDEEYIEYGVIQYRRGSAQAKAEAAAEREYPTPVTDPKEMAGWMAREEAAYQEGYATGHAAAKDQAKRFAAERERPTGPDTRDYWDGYSDGLAAERVGLDVLTEIEKQLPDDWPYTGPDEVLWSEAHGYNDALDRVREIIKNARLVPAAVERHNPGESHRYRIECEVCGQRGMVNLSIEPQEASPAATPDLRAAGEAMREAITTGIDYGAYPKIAAAVDGWRRALAAPAATGCTCLGNDACGGFRCG